MGELRGRLWTIGHSTRPLELFTSMLRDAEIRTLVDVRRFAGSRRNPQYSADSLAQALPDHGVGYIAMPALGGRRHPRPDTRNLAWRNAAFRGYADYMETGDFAAAGQLLARYAASARTAVMCAEALWWQCHRSLIADHFKAGGWEVVHLVGPGRTQAHPYTPAARIVDGRLDYSLPEPPQGSLF